MGHKWHSVRGSVSRERGSVVVRPSAVVVVSFVLAKEGSVDVSLTLEGPNKNLRCLSLSLRTKPRMLWDKLTVSSSKPKE